MKVGPEKSEPTWATWDPVLAGKIIDDNYEHFKLLTEDEGFKG
jgi:hypothetical protein